MSDPSNIPDEPFNFRSLSVPIEEIDYLAAYWEIRDHVQLFSWSIRLLHDLTKLDEKGWRLAFSKAEVDELSKQVHYNSDYKQMISLLKWFAPSEKGFARIRVEDVERVCKKTDQISHD